MLDGGTYWGAEYTQRAFATSYWSTRPYLNQVAQGALPTATYPETHWPPAGSNFEDLYNQAIAEVDQEKRYAIIREMQQMEYDDGGNIIAYFQNLIDGHAASVQAPCRDRTCSTSSPTSRTSSTVTPRPCKAPCRDRTCSTSTTSAAVGRTSGSSSRPLGVWRRAQPGRHTPARFSWGSSNSSFGG